MEQAEASLVPASQHKSILHVLLIIMRDTFDAIKIL